MKIVAIMLTCVPCSWGLRLPNAIASVILTSLSSFGPFSQYDTYSSSYELINGGTIAESLGVGSLRASAGKYVAGNVLEVAVGTGLQLKFYDWSKISSYTGIDSSRGMLQMAQSKAGDFSQNLAFKTMDATKLDYEDGKFDTVVDTFSMCVMSDPGSALSEAARVIKPDGRIVLIENSRSSNQLLGLYQDLTEPFVTPFSKQCRWNTDVPSLALRNGLRPIYREDYDLGTLVLLVLTKKLE